MSRLKLISLAGLASLLLLIWSLGLQSSVGTSELSPRLSTSEARNNLDQKVDSIKVKSRTSSLSARLEVNHPSGEGAHQRFDSDAMVYFLPVDSQARIQVSQYWNDPAKRYRSFLGFLNKLGRRMSQADLAEFQLEEGSQGGFLVIADQANTGWQVVLAGERSVAGTVSDFHSLSESTVFRTVAPSGDHQSCRAIVRLDMAIDGKSNVIEQKVTTDSGEADMKLLRGWQAVGVYVKLLEMEVAMSAYAMNPVRNPSIKFHESDIGALLDLRVDSAVDVLYRVCSSDGTALKSPMYGRLSFMGHPGMDVPISADGRGIIRVRGIASGHECHLDIEAPKASFSFEDAHSSYFPNSAKRTVPLVVNHSFVSGDAASTSGHTIETPFKESTVGFIFDAGSDLSKEDIAQIKTYFYPNVVHSKRAAATGPPSQTEANFITYLYSSREVPAVPIDVAVKCVLSRGGAPEKRYCGTLQGRPREFAPPKVLKLRPDRIAYAGKVSLLGSELDEAVTVVASASTEEGGAIVPIRDGGIRGVSWIGGEFVIYESMMDMQALSEARRGAMVTFRVLSSKYRNLNSQEPVSLGEKNVQVEVRRSGSISGQVVLHPSVRPDHFSVALLDGRAEIERVALADDGRFFLLEPDEAVDWITVRERSSMEEVWRSRLGPDSWHGQSHVVDLYSELMLLEVRVVSETGVGLKDVAIHYLRGDEGLNRDREMSSDAEPRLSATRVSGRNPFHFVSRAGGSVVAHARGHISQEVKVNGGLQEIHLAPAPKSLLVFKPPADSTDDDVFCLQCTPQDARLGVKSLNWRLSAGENYLPFVERTGPLRLKVVRRSSTGAFYAYVAFTADIHDGPRFDRGVSTVMSVDVGVEYKMTLDAR